MADSDDIQKAERRIKEAIKTEAQALDLSGLSGLTSLAALDVDIGDATSVRSLNLRNTPITDLGPIAGLNAITSLNLGGTQITDLAPIAGLNAITTLDFNDTQITDLAPIAGLNAITRLSLNGTQITDLTPIAGLYAITTLNISGTQITDLAPIAGLYAITTLNLSGTQITDLAPIAGLNAITSLDFSDTQITDLAPIAGLNAITTLDFSDTQITDLAPIAGLNAITWLDLSDTQITDLAPIAGLNAITSLYLRRTQITDLAPIAGLNAITTLNLDHTPVADFAVLSGLNKLDVLYLEATRFSDLSVLPRRARFDQLDLKDSDVADLRPARDLHFVDEADELTLRVTNTPAARADPRIAEIDAMDDHNERVKTLLDYLKDWVPPVPADMKQARSYRFDGEKPLQSISAYPDEDDADQKDLQKDLQSKAESLAGYIGGSNELGHLSESVKNYARQINKPLAELRLKLLYSAANSLRVAYEAHNEAKDQARDMECLPPRVAATLQDLVETHALFYMGFPEGVTIHQTMMSGLTGQRQPDVAQLATDLVEALRGHEDVITPQDQAALADDATAATGEGPSAEIGERSLIGSLGNAFGAVGRFVWAHKGKLLSGVVASYPALKWMVAKEAAITQFLVAFQGPMASWFKAMIEFVKPWV